MMQHLFSVWAQTADEEGFSFCQGFQQLTERSLQEETKALLYMSIFTHSLPFCCTCIAHSVPGTEHWYSEVSSSCASEVETWWCGHEDQQWTSESVNPEGSAHTCTVRENNGYNNNTNFNTQSILLQKDTIQYECKETKGDVAVPSESAACAWCSYSSCKEETKRWACGYSAERVSTLLLWVMQWWGSLKEAFKAEWMRKAENEMRTLG